MVEQGVEVNLCDNCGYDVEETIFCVFCGRNHCLSNGCHHKHLQRSAYCVQMAAAA